MDNARMQRELDAHRSREGERRQSLAALGVFALLVGLGLLLSFFV